MKSQRTTPEIAAGKLISAIQREWTSELGDPCAEASEVVLQSAHRLLVAVKEGNIQRIVGAKNISEFLGSDWIRSHARVWPHVQMLEAAILPSESDGPA